ncbi:hypothetical protein TrLO_g6119 [Triparma laevis f. longispina]|uniref:PH domain-containing protein n=1 Tax=Triparma laevis f. longispina TaxID=1714387 RepID=A0A9W7A8K1_9STRA|nr:hypothetical protein TrLO_g6119 [Triparma laevis f. longispina]
MSSSAFHRLKIATLNDEEVHETIQARSRPSPLRKVILEDVNAKVKFHTERFSAKKEENNLSRALRRQEENDRRKNYKPRSVDTAWLDNFDPKEYIVNPIKWNERGLHGNRLAMCLICWKGLAPGAATFACQLCPSMAHKSCCAKANLGLEPSPGGQTSSWWCSQCIEEIEVAEEGEATKLDKMIKRKKEFEMSRKMQANFMRFAERNRFLRLLGGLKFLQAVVRRQQTQGKFNKELMTTFRPFRIKASYFNNLRDVKAEGDIKGNATCIMTMYKNVKNADLEEGERHIYRFDTCTRQTSVSGDWGESFPIASCDAQWDFIATVVDRDEAGRNDFLGQAIVNAGPYVKRAMMTHKKVQEIEMDLGPLQIEPRDTSNKQAMRLDTLSNANKAFPGKLGVEIHFYSNVTTKTGFLDEMLTQSLRGAKKKWWAVWLGNTLSLYTKKGDVRPKRMIQLKASTPISLHNGQFLKISAMNETLRFTHSNEDERKDWFHKITGKYLKTLQKGTEDYKKQCKRERKREEKRRRELAKAEEEKGGEEEEGKFGEEEEGKFAEEEKEENFGEEEKEDGGGVTFED